MSALKIIAKLRRELADAHALIRAQNTALLAQGAEAMDAPTGLLAQLTVQERDLLGLLFRAYPRALSHGVIADLLPVRDHARERQSDKIASVVICKVRASLGRESIETVRGLGFRLGAELHGLLAEKGSPK